MEYSRILKEIYEEIQPYAREGKPASYIPELLKVNPDRYGICLRTIEGKEYAQGDSDERFAYAFPKFATYPAKAHGKRKYF